MNTDFYFKKTSYSKKKINLLFIFSITFFFPLLIFTKTPGYNPYSINELLIILTMIIWSLVLLYKKNIHKIQGAYVFLILIYFFFQAVLATASASYLAAFSSLLLHNKYIILSFLVFFFIDIKNEVFLIKSIVLVAVAAIWIGTLKIIENPSQMLSLYGVGGYSRNASVFPNPNMFGVYVLVTIFLELYLFDSIKNNKKKIVFIVFILLPSLLSLLMSFSRRAWGLFIIGSFFYFLFKKGDKLFFVTSVLLISVLLMKSIDYNSILDRFLLIFDSSYESNYLRGDAFYLQIRVVLGSLFTTLGGDGVGMVGPSSIFASEGKWKKIDNYYMIMLLEYGTIVLILYLLIFLNVIFYGVKVLKKNKDNSQIYNKMILYLVIIISLYVNGIVGTTPITFPLNMLQWIIIGVVLKNHALFCRRRYEKI